jgi:hypothetical protein
MSEECYQMSNIIKSILVGLALFVSANAHAKLQEFEEVFTGTLPPIVSSEFGFYDEVATLQSEDATLTLYYQVVSDVTLNFIGGGTFTRTDALGAFSGRFLFYLSLPDYLASNNQEVSLSGFFDRDRDSTLPNTGAYQYAWAFGDAGAYGSGGGSITDQGDMTFKIKWQIRTPDPLTPVPEPQMSWLFLLGLILLSFGRIQKTMK